MSDDFRFSRATVAYGNDKCCGKEGCSNITEQCSLRKLHRWQIQKAGGTVIDAIAYPRTHPGKRRDLDADQVGDDAS